MPDRIELVLPRPHAGQREIIAGAKRYNVVSCGRRFGKTTMGAILMAENLLRHRRSCGWFAPTYRLLEEAYNDQRRLLAPIISRAVVSPFPRIELLTGAAIDYWTLGEPATVARGRKYAWVGIDEAAMAVYLEEAWTQAIRPTLTDYAGSAWFFSTPKGHNYFKTLFDIARDDEEWTNWTMPTLANPYIPPAEIDAAKRMLPSIAFRQEYLAEFVDAEGARLRREWIRTGTPPAELEVYLGVDLAISTKEGADWTAVVAMGRDGAGTIWVLDAARIRAPFDGVLRFVQDMAAKWRPKVIGIEQVQYQAAVVQELLRTTRLPVRGIRPDRDKVTRFLPLEARYEQGLVVHATSLPAWFADELLSFPIGSHDDAVDAASYAWAAMGAARSFAAV